MWCCWWKSRYGAYKRGLNSKIHLAVDALGRIIKTFITAGTIHDCNLASSLIEGLDADIILADKAYDTNDIISLALDYGMEVCIPPKKNRKEQRYYDQELYKWRYIIENTILMLKGWRGIATRYTKNTDSFLAAVQIRSMFDWISHGV